MNKLSILALAGLGVLSATAANAQTPTDPVTKPISLKIGGLFISDGDTRRGVGNPIITLGATYDFGKTATANPIIYSAYLDYFVRKTKNSDVNVPGVGTFRQRAQAEGIGLGAQVRYLIIPPAAGTQFTPYVGAGLGVYNLRGKAEAGGFSTSKSTTGVGGKIFTGIELPVGLLGELEYNILPKIGGGLDAKLSGFGARIGYRF